MTRDDYYYQLSTGEKKVIDETYYENTPVHFYNPYETSYKPKKTIGTITENDIYGENGVFAKASELATKALIKKSGGDKNIEKASELVEDLIQVSEQFYGKGSINEKIITAQKELENAGLKEIKESMGKISEYTSYQDKFIPNLIEHIDEWKKIIEKGCKQWDIIISDPLTETFANFSDDKESTVCVKPTAIKKTEALNSMMKSLYEELSSLSSDMDVQAKTARLKKFFSRVNSEYANQEVSFRGKGASYKKKKDTNITLSNLFYYLEMNYDKLAGFMVETGTVAFLQELEKYKEVVLAGNDYVKMLYNNNYSTRAKTDFSVDGFNISAKFHLDNVKPNENKKNTSPTTAFQNHTLNAILAQTLAVGGGRQQPYKAAILLHLYHKNGLDDSFKRFVIWTMGVKSIVGNNRDDAVDIIYDTLHGIRFVSDLFNDFVRKENQKTLSVSKSKDTKYDVIGNFMKDRILTSSEVDEAISEYSFKITSKN